VSGDGNVFESDCERIQDPALAVSFEPNVLLETRTAITVQASSAPRGGTLEVQLAGVDRKKVVAGSVMVGG